MPYLCKPKQEKLPSLAAALVTDDIVSLKGALSELANLLHAEKEGEGVRVSLFRSYGHLLVLTVMKRHAKSPEVQYECLRVISAMCLANKRISLSSVGGIGNICIGLAAAGTLQSIRDALLSFSDIMRVRKGALRALNNIVGSKDIVPLFMELSIFPVLIQCMSDFPDDVSVQEDGCRILRFVAANPKAKVYFKKEGVVRMLADVIERFDDETNTYKQACRTWSVIVG